MGWNATLLASVSDKVGTLSSSLLSESKYLYDIMKDKMAKKGYSMKTYIVGLVRKDLGDEELIHNNAWFLFLGSWNLNGILRGG